MLTETLKELCALPGVSSCEDAVRDYIRAITAPYADRSYTDTLGNLIIEKKGVSPGTKKVMLAAHMDEVGLMVHTITEDDTSNSVRSVESTAVFCSENRSWWESRNCPGSLA